MRNYLFDIGYKTSFEFDRCIINVGNLSVGGTGKSPMVEYLIRLLKDDLKITTLSRGYGRKTSGFRLASRDDTATTLGDEPFQFYRKFEDIEVAVGEERAVAIPFILAERPETDVILLDDAYQHRYVKPNFNILLTSHNRPFFNDWVVPSGRLREARKGARRADCIIVTKCPEDMEKEEKAMFMHQIGRYSDAPVYFTKIDYKEPLPVFDKDISWSNNVFLITGIANPSHLKDYVENKYKLSGELHFNDHHHFSKEDINKLLEANSTNNQMVFLTTEKDMVRLIANESREQIEKLPLFYVPIATNFLDDGEKFDSSILKVVKSDLH